MNRAVLLSLLCLPLARVGAQVIEAFPPVESYKGEARIGLVTSPARRTSVASGATAPPGSGTLSGAELYVRASNIGVYVRSISGEFDQSDQVVGKKYSLQEARLLIGSTGLSMEGGVARRIATSDADPLATKKQMLYRAGARSQWGIGGSRLLVSLAAGGRFANVKNGSTKALKFLGFDAEGSLLGQAPKNLPLYAIVGWRYERFDDPWGTNLRVEEQAGPFFGVGIRFAGRPELR
ncbi:MAG: hypothetical protein V4558_03335 [Gemmatimonadota bacterium]